MGWWKQEGTDDVVGDAPLEILADAVSQVIKAYIDQLKRPPTAREWEALLSGALERESERLFMENSDTVTVKGVPEPPPSIAPPISSRGS